LEEKFIATMLSHALGDALGAPFEGMSTKPNLKEEIILKRDFYKYTDDTIMSLIIARSIVKNGKYNPEDIAKGYLEWLYSGDLRGIGVTTYSALRNLDLSKDYRRSGIINKWAAGNGVAMRIHPIALFLIKAPLDELYETIRVESYITHRNELAISGAFAVALMIKRAVEAKKKEEVIEYAIKNLEEFGIENRVYDSLIQALDLYNKGEEYFGAVYKLGNSGFVVHTVSLTAFTFLVSRSVMETIINLIRAGGDTDTNAAIGAAIAGAFYGLETDIETRSYSLESRDEIISLAKELYKLAIGQEKKNS